MNIYCRKTKCKYNKNYVCTSKKIMIEDNLNCAYFEPIKKDDIQDASKYMFDIAPKIESFRDNKEVVINCKADCIFNKNNKCVSNGIFINGENKKMHIKKDDMISKNKQDNGESGKNPIINSEAICFSYVKR